MDAPNKAEKVNLVTTPDSWDEIVKFCERASTPSDATVAALMAWNFCVDWHAKQESCCDELRKLRESNELTYAEYLAARTNFERECE